MLIEVGSENNPPELDKALLGLGLGEMRDFVSGVEGEGEEKTEVPGRVLLKGVKERKLPEVDDEFIKGLGLGPETVDAMRTEIRERLVTGRSDKARAEQDDQAVQHLLEQNPVEMPKALVEHEAESRIRRGMENLARQGVDLKTINVDWAAEFERARGGLDDDGLFARMRHILEIVKQGVTGGLAGTEYTDRILPQQSHRYREMMAQGQLLDGGISAAYVASDLGAADET